jgi:hypothetical protein
MRIARTAALLAATASLVAASAATASTASLRISRTPDNQCRMQVGAISTKPMAHSGYVDVRIWGDDTYSDDFLTGPVRFSYSGGFANEFWMPGLCSALDEDWGVDEIYAGMRIYDGVTGKQVDAIESNRVRGSF